LKLLDPETTKKLNKEILCWRKRFESDKGLSKYRLQKMINKQHSLGLKIEEIVKFVDDFNPDEII
jgi:hypothetical protein